MTIRLQRFLADCGVASRRECEEMILGGRVRVNGVARTTMPVMIDPEKDVVTVDDQVISMPGTEAMQQKVYFLLNKPKGILVTSHDPANRKTVGELMTGVKERVFPVGRLDMDSRGALIMTNDGELANRLTHPRFGVKKTYVVEVDGRIGHGELEKLKRGTWLGPKHAGAQGATRTEKFHIKVIGRERGRTILELVLEEGRNSEIRRVMARIGHVVRDLNRVAIAGKITIQNLKVGDFRPLSEAEVKWLYKSSTPEFHSEKRAATQAWYEAKEMEKERKRLARAEPEPEERPAKVEIRSPKPESPKREKRMRPERKGRKPFVPPSGRNAGKPLGGNYIGKRRSEMESLESEPHSPAVHEKTDHPLGDAAGGDE